MKWNKNCFPIHSPSFHKWAEGIAIHKSWFWRIDTALERKGMVRRRGGLGPDYCNLLHRADREIATPSWFSICSLLTSKCAREDKRKGGKEDRRKWHFLFLSVPSALLASIAPFLLSSRMADPIWQRRQTYHDCKKERSLSLDGKIAVDHKLQKGLPKITTSAIALLDWSKFSTTQSNFVPFFGTNRRPPAVIGHRTLQKKVQ